jgi:D-sedoheptulose 7-phosphate isomerase
MEISKIIASHFTELTASLLTVERSEIGRAVELLRESRERKANVWIVGNGGSAATASHFANDLVKMAGVRAFAVPDMTPLVTAYGNDEGWERMFQNPIDRFLEPDDCVVAISCSGKSPNVIKAANGIPNLIVLTGNGRDGNILAALQCKALLLVKSDDITIVEDCHLAICHAIAKALME